MKQFLIVLLVAAVPPATESLLFRENLTLGESWRLHLSASASAEVDLGVMAQLMERERISVYAAMGEASIPFTVVGVKEGVARVAGELDWVKLSVDKGGGMEEILNQHKDPSQPPQNGEEIVGVPFVMGIEALGRVVSWEFAEWGLNPSEEGFDIPLMGLGGVTPPGFPLLGGYPQEPIALGSSWEESIPLGDSDSPIAGAITLTHRWDRREGDLFFLSHHGFLDVEGGADDENPMGVLMGGWNLSGTSTWHLEEGFLTTTLSLSPSVPITLEGMTAKIDVTVTFTKRPYDEALFILPRVPEDGEMITPGAIRP
ncbi:hypothetical protein H8D30_02610 [bacterium]|nr:hypothetical protein [bacterium]